MRVRMSRRSYPGRHAENCCAPAAPAAPAVGRVLRYVAEYVGQCVALLVLSPPALHLKLGGQGLHWTPRQVKERRCLIAQNARFLLLGDPGRGTNPAPRVLELTCERLPQYWQEHFGYPVLAMETFVQPDRFRAPVIRRPAGSSWGSPEAVNGTGATFTRTPNIPGNSGSEP